MTKILIIEDDQFMTRMMKNAFEMEGFEIGTAANGKEGLTHVTEHSPDLILLDLMMPEMNGIEFLETIKENDAAKNIPVVVLTNLAGANDAKLAISKGAAKFLVKSEQNPQKVVEMVKELLNMVHVSD